MANQIDYGMRVYDPRVGRFLSRDPISAKYPGLTPYQFASNTPIQAIDLDGEEAGFIVNWLADKAKVAGSPRLSGFIRSFGGSDPWYNAKELGSKIFHGDIKGAATQVASYSPAGMLYNLGATAYHAVKGDKEAQGSLVGTATQVIIGHAVAGTGGARPPDVVAEETTNTSAEAVHGTAESVQANPPTQSVRPTPSQSEADLTPNDPGEFNQQAFKNGNFVSSNTKGSVRPESYNFLFGGATEVKNFTFKPEGVNKSSMKNLVTQIIQRQSNLPSGTTQNVILDLRGQNVGVMQQMQFRSQVLTQLGNTAKNVTIDFETDKK